MVSPGFCCLLVCSFLVFSVIYHGTFSCMLQQIYSLFLYMSNVTPKRKQYLCLCIVYIHCSTIVFKQFITTAKHKKLIQINFKYLLLQQDIKCRYFATHFPTFTFLITLFTTLLVWSYKQAQNTRYKCMYFLYRHGVFFLVNIRSSTAT
jgi:hypothetical protein